MIANRAIMQPTSRKEHEHDAGMQGVFMGQEGKGAQGAACLKERTKTSRHAECLGRPGCSRGAGMVFSAQPALRERDTRVWRVLLWVRNEACYGCSLPQGKNRPMMLACRALTKYMWNFSLQVFSTLSLSACRALIRVVCPLINASWSVLIL
eukprot:935391-Pelagomonas_calceolata.AAC.1